MQIAGFIISLVGGFFWGIIGLIMGIVGWVLSAVGRSNAKQAGEKTGLGTAGIVLGIINVIIQVIYLAALGM